MAVRSLGDGGGDSAIPELTVTIVAGARASRCGSAAPVVRTAARKLIPLPVLIGQRQKPVEPRAHRTDIADQDVQPTEGPNRLLDESAGTVRDSSSNCLSRSSKRPWVQILPP
jgi:hypothetical protein